MVGVQAPFFDVDAVAVIAVGVVVVHGDVFWCCLVLLLLLLLLVMLVFCNFHDYC